MSYFLTRRSCPACASTEYTTLYSAQFTQPPLKDFLESFYNPQGTIEFEYLREADFILNECEECGLVYQQQIPDAFLTKKIYTEWIDPQKNYENDILKTGPEYHARSVSEIRMIVAYLKTAPENTECLDFGMGWGRWAMAAHSLGCSVYGMELSEEKSSYAAAQGIVVIGSEKLGGRRFDLINIGEVLEHIPEPKETLSLLANALKPSGLIKISVPDGADIKRRLRVADWSAPKGSRNSLNPVSPLEHINCFFYLSLVHMADKAGLKAVKIPLHLQYRYRSEWSSLEKAAKSLLKPLYENALKRGTCLFFSRKS